jgi:cephalosporin-C deacetylase-like acetyl esterase
MFRVLDDHPAYARAHEAYWRFLLRQCRDHHWRRRQKLLAFTSRSDWEKHCATVRERFRAALGPLPERTPLNPRLVDVFERNGYVIEKLLIESRPGFQVTVNLYRPPEIRSPAPAILNPVGHWPQAKAEEVVQARGIGLARQGYVALVYDPIGQGERSQFWDHVTGTIPVPLGTSQHAAVGNLCFLIGQTLINYMVWDGVRLLDYLETRSDVDANRLGCTGASGGGTYTMFLAAFDPRIKAAVPVCSTSTYERLLSEGQIGEPCQDPVASYRDDLDMADLLMSAAPAAIQIIAATGDFFPLIGAREVYLDLQNCYAALGIPERVSLVEIPAHHDYNRPMREAMYAWFNHWFGNGSSPVEAPFQAEPPERLWCTPTGQLLTSIGGATVPSLIRARAGADATRTPVLEIPADAAVRRAQIRASVREVLGIGTRGSPSLASASEPSRGDGGKGGATILGRATIDGLTIEELVFETEPDLPIPALVFLPAGDGPHPAVLFVDDRGKGVEAEPDGLIPALARAGMLVFAVDLRGWGETAWRRRPSYDPDDAGLLGNDSLLAYVGYLLGTWAITQRITDALRALEVLRGRPDVNANRLIIVGRGVGALVALHVAALETGISGVAVYDCLGCFRSIVEFGRSTYPASGFIPGILLHYDVPDLVGALAPTPTFLANPLDPVGNPLPRATIDEMFASARWMFELLGGGRPLVISEVGHHGELIRMLVSWATQ